MLSVVGRWEQTHSVEWNVKNGKKVPGTERTFYLEPGDVVIIEFKASGDATTYLNGQNWSSSTYEVSGDGKTITLYSDEGMVSLTVALHTASQLVLEGLTYYDDPADPGPYWEETHFKRTD